MNLGSFALPTGRPGQALAAILTLAGMALLWFSLAEPIISLYETGEATLAEQQALAAHLTVLGQEIPQLRIAVAAAGPQSAHQRVLLPGGTDAIAGANLQSALQNLATQAGTSLNSAEMMPVQQIGPLRQIGMQVSVTATWPVLIAYLQSIATASPRMVVGDLSLLNAQQAPDGGDQEIEATFSVSGFAAELP